jgi:hypothetical protein
MNQNGIFGLSNNVQTFFLKVGFESKHANLLLCFHKDNFVETPVCYDNNHRLKTAQKQQF